MRSTRLVRITAAAAVGLAAVGVAVTPTPAAADLPPALVITQDTFIDTTTGAVTPGGGPIGHLQDAPAPGFPQWRVIELSSLTVADGATLTFAGAAVPALHVTGPVAVSGTISVSAVGSRPGPGGGAGGATGFNGTTGVGSAGFGGQGIGGGGGGGVASTGAFVTRADGQSGSGSWPGIGGLGGSGTCPGASGRGGRNGLAVAEDGVCNAASASGMTLHTGGGGGGAGGRIIAPATIAGGSGGGGGASHPDREGGSGGPGGGALRVVSGERVVVTGQLRANGILGAPGVGPGGPGGGGAIWLRAPIIEVPGVMSAMGGLFDSAPGVIQVDADCADLGEGIRPAVTRGTLTGIMSDGPCLPDLAVSALTEPPSSVVQGGSFTVSDSTANVGNAGAAASSTAFALRPVAGSEDILLSPSRTVPTLGSAQSDTSSSFALTVPRSAPSGSYQLVACADAAAEVTELDETNNCALSAGTMRVVKARPDLVVPTVSDPPASRVRGKSFKVTDTVKNRGVARAGASQNAYFLSLDRARGSDRTLTGTRAVPALGAGARSRGTATVTIPAAAPPGTYFVLTCSDGPREITESDETNNCRSSATKVVVTRA